MGVFSRRKRCPICQAENKVALDADVGGAEYLIIVLLSLKAACERCEYKFRFGWLSLLLGAGWLIPPAVMVLHNPFGKYCTAVGVFSVIYIALGLVGFLSIVHTQMFDRFVDRLIIRKAKKLVRKDEKYSWTGSFLSEEMRARVKRWMDEGRQEKR